MKHWSFSSAPNWEYIARMLEDSGDVDMFKETKRRMLRCTTGYVNGKPQAYALTLRTPNDEVYLSGGTKLKGRFSLSFILRLIDLTIAGYNKGMIFSSCDKKNIGTILTLWHAGFNIFEENSEEVLFVKNT